MKKTSYFKQSFLFVTFVATILLSASCNNSQRSTDTKKVAEERNDENFNNTKQEKDAQFLVNAAEINLKQIQLGQLAQQKGSSTHVKELGKMMEDAHTKSQRDLTALARTKSVTIPTSPTDDVRDAYKDLDKKSGTDFDKEYADLMVKRHNDAISTFEKASTDSHDREVKNWATASLSDMRTHLDHSIECQKKCDELASN